LLLEVGPGGGVYESAAWLRNRIESGRVPDVVGPMGMLGLSLFPDLWLELDPLMEGETDHLGMLDPSAADAWRVDGRLFGLPTGVNPSVLSYNRDLFDAAGLPYPPHAYGEPYADGDAWTIDKMRQIAMQLTLDRAGASAQSPDFDPHQIVQYGYDWRWASGKGMAYLFGAGSVVDAEGHIAIPDHWREAYRWYHNSMWTDHFVPDGPTYQNRFRYNPFVSGDIAMLQSHLWYLPRLDGVSFEWDIAALPSYDGAYSVRWDSSAVGITKSTRHPREAFEVAYALTTALELLAVWGDLPFDEPLRAEYVGVLEHNYPGVDWQAALDGLRFLAIPPHESIMPNHAEVYARFDELRDAIESRADLDLEQEIGRLEADLGVLFTAAQSAPLTSSSALPAGQSRPPQ
jgi:multiple sugar transport system substrate-binding protein